MDLFGFDCHIFNYFKRCNRITTEGEEPEAWVVYLGIVPVIIAVHPNIGTGICRTSQHRPYNSIDGRWEGVQSQILQEDIKIQGNRDKK